MDKWEQTVREVIRQDLLSVQYQHELYGGDLQQLLQRQIHRMLQAGMGAQRIVQVAESISAVMYGEVIQAIDEVLYGPNRRFDKPLRPGVELEDPRTVIAYIDASCYPNPGRGRCAAVLIDHQGKTLTERVLDLGQTTSNRAEYEGAILAMQTALELGFERIEIRSDSQLLVRQLQGHYDVQSERLVELYQRARSLMGRFQYVRLVHVPREQNRRAHELASIGS